MTDEEWAAVKAVREKKSAVPPGKCMNFPACRQNSGKDSPACKRCLEAMAVCPYCGDHSGKEVCPRCIKEDAAFCRACLYPTAGIDVCPQCQGGAKMTAAQFKDNPAPQGGVPDGVTVISGPRTGAEAMGRPMPAVSYEIPV